MNTSVGFIENGMRNPIAVIQKEINRTSKQIENEKQVNCPSENPIASAYNTLIEREIKQLGSYKKINQHLTSSFSSQKNSMGNIEDTLNRIKDILLLVANDVHSTEDRRVFGQKLAGNIERIMSSLNAQNEERNYLFAGTKSNEQAVKESSGSYSDNGNQQYKEVSVDKNRRMKTNVNITSAFSTNNDTRLDLLDRLKKLSDDMKQDKPLADYQGEINDLLEPTENAINSIIAANAELAIRIESLASLDKNQQTKIELHKNLSQQLVGMNEIEKYQFIDRLLELHLSKEVLSKILSKNSEFSIWQSIR
ncbi:flagellar hook-filament junction protein [Candidatus Regiella insecticola LSR1]|uniref:Flagellar hook-filament junction protein n=1 Tax=Candidatus Regiella insecticola LSR1 TaxID=663321 RepID=E0WR00_9ENTR|nr:flagellar hook-filament junction protein [Candidatus Regiella insecticola]EFL92560.1 flagellar hook-filament junction protein [Candidatus Regiella insecticola LSR1]